MATIDQLEIQIKADIADLKRRLDEAKGRLMGLKGSGATAAKGVAKVGDSSRQAGAAIVNFNRVVQDAPFGLIAIQNNIEPLFTSFQHLSAKVGGARAAMGIMAKSLLGPAGLIAGLTLVVALLPRMLKKMEEARGSADALGKALSGIIKKEDVAELQGTEAGYRRALVSIEAVLKAFEGVGGMQPFLRFNLAGTASLTDKATKEMRDGWNLMLQSGIIPTRKGVEDLRDRFAAMIKESTDLQQASAFAANFFGEVEKGAKGANKAVKSLNASLAHAVIAAMAGQKPGFEGGKAKSAQEIGLGLGPTTEVIGNLRNATKPAREAAKTVNRELQVTDLLANSIADGFAQMAVNIRSVGDIAKSVFKEIIASLVRIVAFRFVSGILGGIFGGPAGAAAGAAAGGSLSIGGSDAGQSAFTPLVASISVDMRDIVIGIERTKAEHRRLGVNLG